jgi:transposase
MYLRPLYRTVNGRRQAYWALVESHRTAQGPRQRTVAYLGLMDESGRFGVQQAIEPAPTDPQTRLFPEETAAPEFIEIDRTRLRVENCRQYGAPWVALQLIRQLGLDEFLQRVMPPGREAVPWSVTALILVIARLCDPSSELHIAEHFYRNSALDDLLGVPVDRIDDNRLYRALDALLPHKQELEKFLKNRFGELFGIEYDLLLYDVTSTYFEGQAVGNEQAQRGYSRDHRSDCKQVCIGLVVTRCGLPLSYEVFAGNRHDSTTLQEVVDTLEKRYGKAQRVWVMDRGVASEDNITFLREEDRKYIVGTPKSQLPKFQQQMTDGPWHLVRDGLEVQICDAPDGGTEKYLLCRSRERRAKEEAMRLKFATRIEEGLKRMQATLARRNESVAVISRRLGRLLQRNQRASALFDVNVASDADGQTQLTWKRSSKQQWAELSEGCYVLRTNVTEWTDEELWRAYTQLTEAEAAFRIHKTDLSLRPIWHQKQDRVQAHILVCFLAYVLWKFLGQLAQRSGLGHEPRRLLLELAELRMFDVVLPTKSGIELRQRCIGEPSDHQKILLQHLGWSLPKSAKLTTM